jgi:hypothetical protein
MRRPRRFPVVSLAVSLTVPWLAACASDSEEPLLRQFFTASRLRDNGTLAGLAAAQFDPREDGSITTFEIVGSSPETGTPIALKSLAADVEKATAEDVAFTERKDAYQKENLEAIQRVLKAEASGAKISAEDAKVQAAWTQWRQDTVEHSRAVADAKRRLAAATDLVALSASSPRRPVDVAKYDGEMFSKDVTIRAPVLMPDGATIDKTLVVTLQRAVLADAEPIEGKWIVIRVREEKAGA